MHAVFATFLNPYSMGTSDGSLDGMDLSLFAKSNGMGYSRVHYSTFSLWRCVQVTPCVLQWIQSSLFSYRNRKKWIKLLLLRIGNTNSA
jgi:hypothetical protein